MSTHTIDWDRTRESIRRLGTQPQGSLSLGKEELIRLLEPGLVLYGASNDAELVPGLCALYEYSIGHLTERERYQLYRSIEQLAEDATVSLNAFMPFLLNETSLPIVSSATIDYAMINWPVSDSPLDAVYQLIGFLGDKMPVNRGAMLGGLVCLGDRRVNESLYPLLSSFTPDEVQEASKAVTGTPWLASIEFWLTWLERLPGDVSDPLFGHVAAALYRLVDDARLPVFEDGVRNFGYLHRCGEEPFVTRRTFTLDEVARLVGDRLRHIDAREPDPKLLPVVMGKFGISVEQGPSQILEDG